MANDLGVWAYAVVGGVQEEPLSRLSGVGGTPVRAVRAAGLAAVVATVGLEEFGEAPLRRNLENLAWLDATARAHHQVIQALADAGPVVPMRQRHGLPRRPGGCRDAGRTT